MKGRFESMAVALTMAGAPGMGVGAFIGWCMSMSLHRFVLVDRSTGWHEDRETQWYQEQGDGWINVFGGSHRKMPDDKVIDRVQAADFMGLDWKRTSMYVDNGESGWLSPDGVFWGCKYGGHCNLAHYVIQKDYGDMEKSGWVHVDCAPIAGRYTYRSLVPANAAQEKWLQERGHDTDPYGEKAAKRKAETIKLGDYTIDARADREAFERMMARAKR